MPTVYVRAKFSLKVQLSPEGGDDYLIKEWNNVELATQRSQYNNSNLFFTIEAINPNDPTAPIWIQPEQEDLYFGEFVCKKNEQIFEFECDGKFKSSGNKSVKAAVDAGVVFRLTTILINGAGYSLPLPVGADIEVSSKKL